MYIPEMCSLAPAVIVGVRCGVAEQQSEPHKEKAEAVSRKPAESGLRAGSSEETSRLTSRTVVSAQIGHDRHLTLIYCNLS